VAVVGGGVVGLAVAWGLARRGEPCLVLERGTPARAATAAAGGMLSPLGEADGPGAFLELALESLALWPPFVARLEGGADAVGFRTCGKLIAAFSAVEAAALGRRARWISRTGAASASLTPAQARAIEPGLAPDVVAGLHLPAEAVVDPWRLGPALAAAVRAAGVVVETGTPVAALDTRGGRVAGVVLADGRRIGADTVVLAAGAWSGRLEGLPRPLPVHPVRGQMLSLAPGSQPLGGVVGAPGAYLIPRVTDDGARVVVGATQEEVGFREGTEPAALDALHRAAIRALPGLADARVADRWWGFRPGTPDGLPVIGPDPDLGGLVYATGHFRNGILLAPVTAARLVGAVLDGDVRDLEAFRPDRFGA
jgi:glycine oxidase